jgi:hypothetical protein
MHHTPKAFSTASLCFMAVRLPTTADPSGARERQSKKYEGKAENRDKREGQSQSKPEIDQQETGGGRDAHMRRLADHASCSRLAGRNQTLVEEMAKMTVIRGQILIVKATP